MFQKSLSIVPLVLALVSGVALGQNWIEVGDAPDGVPGRQDTVGVGPLTNIRGGTDGVSDFVDTYSINITDPAAFYATTEETFGNLSGTASFDTRLWLWTESGDILLGNDDWPAVAAPFHSLITDPSTFPGVVDPSASNVSLTPGKYLLSISGFSEDPEDANLNDLVDLGVDFDALNGPNASAGPFDHWELLGAGGDYVIELGGATFCEVPEPVSGALLIFGALSLFWARRR